MKYDRLYNFISPVTGKIATWFQLPELQEDYTTIGNNKLEVEQSPILIDIRLNMMDMRYDIDSLRKKDISDAKFIIQTPNVKLPNAQALSDLYNGVLGNKDGVLEILQRVSGPTSSTDNNIARFDGNTGQIIKDSVVKISDIGETYLNSVYVKNIISNTEYITGFKNNTSLNKNLIYYLPLNGGIHNDSLSIDYINLDGSIQTKWSSTFQKPSDDPDAKPVFFPSIPIPISIPLPIPVAVPLPGIPGVPAGTAIPSPAKIDPNSGDIETPGDINGNNGNFDGDLSSQGDLSTQGDIESAGDISADGSVRGSAIDFDDISDISDDFVRMEAPFDLDHSYQIELPDAEPIMQEQIQPPDQRILQTAWRRVRPVSEVNSLLSKNKKVDISLPITKMSWTDIEVEDPITLTFVQATSTTNEKMVIGYNGGGGQNIDIPYAVNLIYGTLNNINGSFGGFNSSAKNYSVKVKTSYHHKIDGSKSSISILNRYDNGYIIQNETNINDECIFKLQNIENNIITDLLSYDQTNSSFKFIKPLEVPAPTLAKHPATKEYVDSIPIGGGVSQIIAGTGLSGGTITTTGTIAIANTAVVSGDYRLANLSVNPQGQLTNVSNGSPSTTTNRAIAVWGNTIGNSLLNTNVTIDTSGNMTSNGASTFLSQQVNNADGVGSLNLISGNYSLQVRLNGALTNNRLWFLPTTNNNGFFKNNGLGTITWSALSSSDINNFSTAVRQEFGQFSFGQNTLRCNEPNLPMFLYSTFNETVLDDKVSIGTGMILDFKRITNLDDPVDLQDAATKNYVDSKPFYTSGDFYIQLNSSNKGGIVIPEGNYVAVPIFDSSGYLYVNSNGKLYYSNRRGTVLLGGA